MRKLADALSGERRSEKLMARRAAEAPAEEEEEEEEEEVEGAAAAATWRCGGGRAARLGGVWQHAAVLGTALWLEGARRGVDGGVRHWRFLPLPPPPPPPPPP